MACPLLGRTRVYALHLRVAQETVPKLMQSHPVFDPSPCSRRLQRFRDVVVGVTLGVAEDILVGDMSWVPLNCLHKGRAHRHTSRFNALRRMALPGGDVDLLGPEVYVTPAKVEQFPSTQSSVDDADDHRSLMVRHGLYQLRDLLRFQEPGRIRYFFQHLHV